MNISSSRTGSLIALFPFGYYWLSRLRTLRDVAYLVVTSWVPVIWLTYGESGMPLSKVLTGFALGYLTFISAYELGYLANDAWDARRHPEGRHRDSGGFGWPWIVAFTVVRIACWVAIGSVTGWLQQPIWLAAYATLAVVFLLHNVLPQPSLRLATFTQLAVLRYILPVAAMVTDGELSTLFIAAILAYVPLRYLSYADSKGLLDVPHRRAPWFAVAYLALTMPLICLAAWHLSSPSLVAVGLFLILAHSVWAVAAGQFRGANR